MELFTYTNPKGDKVYFGYYNPNPAEIADNRFFLLDSYDGLTAADIEPISYKGFAQQGYTLGAVSYGARYININFINHGLDIKDQYRRRRYLAQVFNPLLGQGTLTYQNDFIKLFIDCLPTITPTPVERVAGLLDLENIELTCYNPFWYSSEHKVYLEGFGGGLTFPISFNKQIQFGERGNSATLRVEGDVPSPITVKFTGSSMVNPKLILEDTGEFIEVLTTFSGSSLTITTDYGNKQVLQNGKTSVYHLLNPDSTFFSLAQGENTLKFVPAGGDVRVQVAYRDWYVGV